MVDPSLDVGTVTDTDVLVDALKPSGDDRAVQALQATTPRTTDDFISTVRVRYRAVPP